MDPSKLIGSKVVGVDRGVYCDFAKIFLELPKTKKVVAVAAVYDENLAICPYVASVSGEC